MSAFDKKKTVVDMEFVDLLEHDHAIRQAKFGIMYTTDTMQDYNMAYFWWKKEFRGRYSERYLERSGFDPNTVAKRLEVNETGLLEYIQTKNEFADEIKSFNLSIPNEQIVARKYLQDNGYDWTNHTDTLIEDGITFEEFTAEFKIQMVLVTIPGYYDYSNDEWIMEHEEMVPEINERIIVLSFFHKEQGKTDVVYQFEIINTFYEVPALNVIYGTSDTIGIYYEVYIEKESTLPASVATSEDVILTAIVPIKENDVFSKETLQLKRILNKFGLGGGVLIDSLTEDEDGNPSEIDNAYIMEGLPFNTQDLSEALAPWKTKVIMAKTLYKTFEYLGGITGSANFSMSHLNMTYSFDMKIEEFQESLPNFGPNNIPIKIGEYGAVLEINESEETTPGQQRYLVSTTKTVTDPVYTIYYKESNSFYKKMTITNYVQSFTISGFSFKAYLDSDPEEGRLIIPLEILNDLSFREFVPVHERSFQLLVYAHKVVTIKWYQRGIFKFLITIILTWIFAPAGAAISSILVNAAINFAVAFVLSTVLGMIDNEFLALVLAVVIIVLQAYTGGFDFDMFTVENYLPLANKVIDSASNIYANYVQKELVELKEEAEKNKEEQEEWEASQKPGINVTKAMMDAHFSYGQMNSPDAWFAAMSGEGMYNFDQYFNVQNEIDLRKQVKSG